ncbi:hypothetical protein NST62_00845 [Ureibacillus sp. FSL K6-8385]|uniref:hypothetical protein n=1 Tax=Ureibacillus TaxID=160795 RepID=UPI0015EF769A|nr:hypothetical protein [Ureibacillus terrenus]MED3661213.1 hypothetical protein [Ureibacillus terrenus]MED3764312.1 hypothetical protein [Ureibacillus terrenus]
MLSNTERKNIIQFLVTYFGVEPMQLLNVSDRMLEDTYNFVYSRFEMEADM